MNNKSLRKSYDGLSMYQRLALLDNAISRDDLIEGAAILAGSPRKVFSQPDYCELFEEIGRIRLSNLIVRLGYIIYFDFLVLGGSEKLNVKADSKSKYQLINDLRLTAFLYVRATDSWNAINDELGLRPNYDEEIAKILFAVDLLQCRDALMRECSFSQDEAREYILKRTGKTELKTIEQETDEYREYLKLK